MQFLVEECKNDPDSKAKNTCLSLYTNPQFLSQLAASADIGRHFVRACHFLEGDGFLSPKAYDEIAALLELDRNWQEAAQHLPLTAVAQLDVAMRHPLLTKLQQLVSICIEVFILVYEVRSFSNRVKLSIYLCSKDAVQPASIICARSFFNLIVLHQLSSYFKL